MVRMIMRAVRHPWITVSVVLAVTALMAYVTVGGARIETDLDEYMPSDHPAFVYSDMAEDLFDIHDGVLIAIDSGGSIYDNETLGLIRDISTRLASDFEEIESGDVRSLYTAENIIGSEWGLEVRPFYDALPLSDAEPAALRAAVRANEMVAGRMVSDDESAALVVAEIPGDEYSDALYDRLVAWVDAFDSGAEIHIAGRPIVEGELARLGPADMARMAPLVIAVMAVVLLILLRSALHAAVNLLVVGAGTIWSFGLMTLSGIPVYAVSTMMPVMLIAIGTAFGIHLHNTAHLYARRYPDASRARIAEHAVRSMLRPVSMAAITTAVGFIALLTSQVLPVRYFGLFTAAGVLIEMVLALILVPAAIVAFGIGRAGRRESSPATSDESGTPGSRVAAVLAGRGVLTVTLVASVVALAAFGTSRVWIDTSFLSNFERDSDIVRTDRFVNDHFPGTSSLNIILEADRDNAFREPEVLSAVDRLQRSVAGHEEVGGSFSIADYMKRMHRVMHDDAEEYFAIPETRDLIAQYLLLYEMSGDPDNLNRVVDYDYRTANLTVQLKSDSSAIIEEVIATLDPHRADLDDLGLSVNFAGSGYKSYVFADLLLTGQMWSLLIAFAIVAVLLSVVFRDLVIGILGTVPIAITAVVNFGVMGLLGIPLSSATALISSIAIGIGVDYAIHFIEQFRRHAVIDGSGDLPGIVAAALAHSGRAIIFNAVAVAGGFAVLAFSLFPPNRQVGGLIALNMATSAAATLTVLPVLLMYYYRRSPVFQKQSYATEGASQ